MDISALHAGALTTYQDEEEYKQQLEIKNGHQEYLKTAEAKHKAYEKQLQDIDNSRREVETLRSNNLKLIEARLVCWKKSKEIVDSYDQKCETCTYLLQPADKKKYAGAYPLAQILKDENLDTIEKRKKISTNQIKQRVWPQLEAKGIRANDHSKTLEMGLRKEQLANEDSERYKFRFFWETFNLDHESELDRKRKRDDDLQKAIDEEKAQEQAFAEAKAKRRKIEREQKARIIYERYIENEDDSSIEEDAFNEEEDRANEEEEDHPNEEEDRPDEEIAQGQHADADDLDELD